MQCVKSWRDNAQVHKRGLTSRHPDCRVNIGVVKEKQTKSTRYSRPKHGCLCVYVCVCVCACECSTSACGRYSTKHTASRIAPSPATLHYPAVSLATFFPLCQSSSSRRLAASLLTAMQAPTRVPVRARAATRVALGTRAIRVNLVVSRNSKK